MKKMKVGTKITFGFGLVIALMLVITGAVVLSNSKNIGHINQTNNLTELQRNCNEMKSDFLQARIQSNIIYISDSPEAYEAFLAHCANFEKNYQDVLDVMAEHPDMKIYEQTMAEDFAYYKVWKDGVEQVNLLRQHNRELMASYAQASRSMLDQSAYACDEQFKSLYSDVEKLNAGTLAPSEMKRRSDRLHAAETLKASVNSLLIYSEKMLIKDDPTQLSTINGMNDHLIELATTYHDESQVQLHREAAEAIVTSAQAYRESMNSLVSTMESIHTTTNETRQNGDIAYQAMDEDLATMDNAMHDSMATSISSASSSMVIVLVISALSLMIALFLAFFIARSITKPLQFLSSFIKKVADTGNLNLVEENKADVEHFSAYQDEVGATVVAAKDLFEMMLEQGEILKRISEKDLAQQVHPRTPECTVEVIAAELLDNLNEVIYEIQESSHQVSNGSKQIANGAQSLAQATTEQAAVVEELSASIAQVAEKTRENTDMANRASSLADTIKNNAQRGSTQMNHMMQAVHEINEASQSINKVIKVIDDIAFQTNILALNAAVEAARAGQHGKGFAVVAEEVRSLAAKSAEAAKDTGALIANSMEKAEFGAKIAQETAGSLTEIVAGINESSQIVADIAKSSEEQSMAIDQINTGIGQVSQVVQQNSATSEESASAAKELSTRSGTMAQTASQFKIRHTQPHVQTDMTYHGKKPVSISDLKERQERNAGMGAASGFGKY